MKKNQNRLAFGKVRDKNRVATFFRCVCICSWFYWRSIQLPQIRLSSKMKKD